MARHGNLSWIGPDWGLSRKGPNFWQIPQSALASGSKYAPANKYKYAKYQQIQQQIYQQYKYHNQLLALA